MEGIDWVLWISLTLITIASIPVVLNQVSIRLELREDRRYLDELRKKREQEEKEEQEA